MVTGTEPAATSALVLIVTTGIRTSWAYPPRSISTRSTRLHPHLFHWAAPAWEI